MNINLTYSYETEANASFLVADIDDQKSVIQYQIKMIDGNDIPGLLNVRKYQQDGTVRLSYNVTSKISLSQVIERQKMTKDEFLTLLDGILECCSELIEYQLPICGLELREEYIFVKYGKFNPYLVYLPLFSEDNGLENICGFVRTIIMESRILSTNDNFVQQMLDLLNKKDLTIEVFKKTLSQMRSPAENKANIPQTPDFAPQPPVFEPADKVSNSVKPTKTEEKPSNNSSTYIKERPNTANKTKASSKAKQKAGNKKKQKSDKDEKKSTIFIAVQAVILIAVALLIKNGLFIGDAGTLNISYIAGVLIAIAGIDFVLYRELYVNNKQKKSKVNNKKNTSKKIHQEKQTSVKRELNQEIPVPEVKAEASSVQAPAASNAGYAEPVRSYTPVPANDVSEYESDDTVVFDESIYGEGYLEYYENGLVNRIHIKQGVTRVGSRAQGVDHVIASNRVSKIHAEFVRDGDRYFVRDINSTNGTYINGGHERIVSNQNIEIHPGDTIRLANIELTFKC